MSIRSEPVSSHITLAGCTILHSFTHALPTMFAPLYLLMATDLHLQGVKLVTLLLTVYGCVYYIFSFAAGILADRFDRRMLLGIGLIGNAAAVMAIGFTHSYAPMLGLAVLAGFFGAIFHPAGNALAAAHYPKSPGMAIGLMGVGSGLGFWAGPQYAGWRATLTGHWQTPCVELGAFGIIVGLAFVILARETNPRHAHHDTPLHPHVGKRLRRRAYAIASLLCWRDFAGTAVVTLASVFLQKAYGLDAARTGYILGTMMIISIIVNPLTVYLSAGHRRLPTLTIILIGAGLTIAIVPLIPLWMVLPVLCVFQAFSLGSYAVGDAAILERVPAQMRGRFSGFFLTLVGTFSSTAPWVMGFWTDHLGEHANHPRGYILPFAAVGAMLIFSSLGVRLIAHLTDVEKPIASEILATAQPICPSAVG